MQCQHSLTTKDGNKMYSGFGDNKFAQKFDLFHKFK